MKANNLSFREGSWVGADSSLSVMVNLSNIWGRNKGGPTCVRRNRESGGVLTRYLNWSLQFGPSIDQGKVISASPSKSVFMSRQRRQKRRGQDPFEKGFERRKGENWGRPQGHMEPSSKESEGGKREKIGAIRKGRKPPILASSESKSQHGINTTMGYKPGRRGGDR